MLDELTAGHLRIDGHEGDEIQAYRARPGGEGPFGGVVVIHHMPGFDEATKEITRRFAAHGYVAICPNLHWREAPGAKPSDAAAIARANGGVPDDRLLGDVEGAVRYLRALPECNGRVATVGFCSGGRQSFLAACSMPLEAAVDCYGSFIVNEPPPELGLTATPIVRGAERLTCPLLGLFGAEDGNPGPEEVAELEEVLRDADKDVSFHTFAGAGHAFFATDRPSYRPEAATRGWEVIWEFLGRHLAARGPEGPRGHAAGSAAT